MTTLQRLECATCNRFVTRWGKDRDRYDWLPVVVVESNSKRLIERVHAFSRWNGKSLCGHQVRP